MGVTVRNVNDDTNRTLIRSHLAKEAARFRAGNFADPGGIHGADMPGLSALQGGAGRVDIAYADIDGGAQIAFTTTDAGLVNAIHAWFEAQAADHGADAMADMGGAEPMDHSTHPGSPPTLP